MLAIALAAALAAVPDLPGIDLVPEEADALLEALLRDDAREPRAPPCTEHHGWVGDAVDGGARELQPCDDGDAWLRAPRPIAGDEDRDDREDG